MQVAERVPLSELTTFKVGGDALYVVGCQTESDIEDALALARREGLPFFTLGGGSNVLARDEGYDGVILRPLMDGIIFTPGRDVVTVIAGADERWDDLVRKVADKGLWGVENLAGIPGAVGGAPVQNIGAYGMELHETLQYVDAYDARAKQTVRISSDECGFGYRDSRFKHEPDLIILRAAFTFKAHGEPRAEYKDVAAYAEKHRLKTPEDVGNAIRAIRSEKFPDLKMFGTAGSFFKNPIIPSDAFMTLKRRYPELPGFPATSGVKIPLAWILDNVLHLRSFRQGKAWLFERQPLVLVADKGADAEEIEALAQEVELRVKDATGILLEREVRMLV